MNAANPSFFPPAFPATWASEWGEDRFGLFMVLDVNGIRQRFRWLLPGSFIMGSPLSEPGRLDSETRHRVKLTTGFWLADSACAQALWTVVMGCRPICDSQHHNSLIFF